MKAKQPSQQADKLCDITDEGVPLEGLEESLATLLAKAVELGVYQGEELWSEVMRAYATLYPETAISVFAAQVEALNHDQGLMSLSQSISLHGEQLATVDRSELVEALLRAAKKHADEPTWYRRLISAAAELSEPEQAAALFVDMLRGRGGGEWLAALSLAELGRGELVEEHLDVLREMLDSDKDLEGAIEAVTALGEHARALTPKLLEVAARIPDLFGMPDALKAVGATIQDVPRLEFDVARLRELCQSQASQWSEILTQLQAVPAEADDAALLAEVEALLVQRPARFRSALVTQGFDATKVDRRWTSLVTHVSVECSEWGAEEFKAFVETSPYHHLKELKVSAPIGDAGVQALLGAPWIHEVETLTLYWIKASDAVAGLIVQAKPAKLRKLDLQFHSFEDDDAVQAELSQLGLESVILYQSLDDEDDEDYEDEDDEDYEDED